MRFLVYYCSSVCNLVLSWTGFYFLGWCLHWCFFFFYKSLSLYLPLSMSIYLSPLYLSLPLFLSLTLSPLSSLSPPLSHTPREWLGIVFSLCWEILRVKKNLLILKKTITKVNQLIGPRSYACNGPQRTKIKHL